MQHMITADCDEAIVDKVIAGERISTEDARALYELPLPELGELANRRRELAKAKAFGGRGNEIVTYIVDRNINYTNVCNVYCKFCAFYRTEKDHDHYVLSHEQLDEKLDELTAIGGVQILLEPVHMVIGGQLMFVHTVRQGLDVVEAVGSPALRLLADVYHGAVTGESFEQAFADRIELVGHVQVADHESRHEPGTGTLPWATLVPLLRQRGYTGAIGLEYLPTLPIAESLAFARRSLGL